MFSPVARPLSTFIIVTTSTMLSLMLRTMMSINPKSFEQVIYPPDKTMEILHSTNRQFDFVVIGGGSAGSVLAARLSEVKSWKVALIELGKDPSTISEVPQCTFVLQHTDQNYGYQPEYDEGSCLSMRNQRCNWAKGKALGGSSVINAMLYIPGNKRDFDDWAAAGNPGWSYEEVLPYFKKSQQMQPDYIREHGTKYFGTGGPLPIRKFNSSFHEIQDILLRATESLGYKTLDAFHAEDQVGFGKSHGTVDGGRRFNVAKAFLAPAKDRKNLYVFKGARGNRVIITENTATGVEVTLSTGHTVVFNARKEVILSAGSIVSPQILMLSGIGPKEHLTDLGIPVVVDLPVGQNLQDHLVMYGMYFGYENKSRPSQVVQIMDSARSYISDRAGDLAAFQGHDLLGFIDTMNMTAEYPDVAFMAVVIPKRSLIAATSWCDGIGMDEKVFDLIVQESRTQDMIFVSPTALHPKSRGNVTLRSRNPQDTVVIRANYLQNRDDLDTLMRAAKFTESLAETPSFKRHGLKFKYVGVSACKKYEYNTNELRECSIRHLAGTQWHPSGTCKMGPKEDRTSVVDSKLRVHAIAGLRVIDASIMPWVTSGNTHAPTIMIAEKGADLIKSTWQR